MAAGAAAAVRRQRLRGADIRDRLVSDVGAVRRLLLGIDRCAARHVHGRHVPRQFPSAALCLPETSPAEGIRVPRDRDRHHRPAADSGAAAGRSCVHRVGRLRSDGVPAARPGCEHLSPAADARDGRHAARRCAMGQDDPGRRVVARVFLRRQHRRRGHGDTARGLLLAARVRHEHRDLRGGRDQFCRRWTGPAGCVEYADATPTALPAAGSPGFRLRSYPESPIPNPDL